MPAAPVIWRKLRRCIQRLLDLDCCRPRGPFRCCADAALDPHAEERSVHIEHRGYEERHGQYPSEGTGTALGEVYAKLHRQEAEQGGELDDRIHGDGRRVLERITYCVPDDGRVVEWGSLH